MAFAQVDSNKHWQTTVSDLQKAAIRMHWDRVQIEYQACCHGGFNLNSKGSELVQEGAPHPADAGKNVAPSHAEDPLPIEQGAAFIHASVGVVDALPAPQPRDIGKYVVPSHAKDLLPTEMQAVSVHAGVSVVEALPLQPRVIASEEGGGQ